MKKIEALGLQTVPEIKQADNLAQIIADCAKNEIDGLQEKDIIVLTSTSALLFGQVAAGIPAVVIRGYEYEINETANISNTLVPKPGAPDIAKAIKATLRATSYVHGLKTRLLLRIASWFV